ncbi:MAG: SIMPL domain-containing protein, partial [Bdellovibrionales bacterium]
EKALKMTQALQAKLGEPISIQEGGSSRPTPMPYYESVASDMAGSRGMSKSTPTIEAKSQTITVDVSVQFSLK